LSRHASVKLSLPEDFGDAARLREEDDGAA
jgi:hypothetical protein